MILNLEFLIFLVRNNPLGSVFKKNNLIKKIACPFQEKLPTM